MDRNVLFPWFPIKNIMKHLVQKNRIVLLVVLMRGPLLASSPYVSYKSQKESSLVSWAWVQTRANSTLCSPHRSVLLRVQTHRDPTFPSHQLSFPGSPLREKVDIMGERRWTLRERGRRETIYKWLTLTCVL